MSERRTILSHTDTIRKLIKQFSDDSVFDQEFLYKLFIDSRAVLLNRNTDKLQYNSEWNFQTFPVPLDIAEYVIDVNLPEDVICKIRKSRWKIPRPFTTKMQDVISITTYDGVPISKGDAFKASLLKYTRTMVDKPLYEIQNDYLILHNTLTLKAVKIRIIAADPLEVAQFPRCNTDGTYTDQTCFNIDNEFIPLDPEFNDPVYALCLQKLGFTYKLPEDQSNNSKSPVNEE